MDIEYRENTLTANDFLSIQKKMGWTQDPYELLEKSLSNGIVTIAAIGNNEIIGMGRLVGDSAMYWYIQDVVVLTEYQGLGIGSEIVNRLIEYVKLNSLQGTSVSIYLMSAKGKEGFYEKLGFKSRPHEYEGSGMEMEIEMV